MYVSEIVMVTSIFWLFSVSFLWVIGWLAKWMWPNRKMAVCWILRVAWLHPRSQISIWTEMNLSLEIGICFWGDELRNIQANVLRLVVWVSLSIWDHHIMVECGRFGKGVRTIMHPREKILQLMEACTIDMDTTQTRKLKHNKFLKSRKREHGEMTSMIRFAYAYVYMLWTSKSVVISTCFLDLERNTTENFIDKSVDYNEVTKVKGENWEFNKIPHVIQLYEAPHKFA